MVRWTFVLTDHAFVPLGEISNASDRVVQRTLNNIDTASFKVGVRNPLTDAILAGGCYVKGYRNDPRNPEVTGSQMGTLEFFGPVISSEEVFDRQSQSVSVNCASPAWFFAKRLAGKSKTGTIFSNTDRAQIIKALIDTANNEAQAIVGTPPDVHGVDLSFGIATHDITDGPTLYTPPDVSGAITTGQPGGLINVGRPQSDGGSSTISAASRVNYTAGPYKSIMDCIKELSPGIDGFDWTLFPYDNYAGGVVTTAYVAEFRAWPLMGRQSAEAVFEYGSGRNNIESYQRLISRDTQANFVYHNAPPGPDATGYPTKYAGDMASELIYRLMEDVATGDLYDSALRQALVDEHVRVRAYPRQTMTFVPHIDTGDGRMPIYGLWNSDFFLGDQVRARIVVDGSTRLDAWTRVYGVGFEIDGNGLERMKLTLAQE